MKNNRKQKIASLFGILAGIGWIFAGVKNIFVARYANVLIGFLGLMMIVVNISIFKDTLK